MNKSWIFAIAIVVLAVSAQADGRKFSAADLPNVKIKPGKIVIKNDSQRITAFRFFNDIREALFSLRTTRKIVANPFGGTLFNSQARLSAGVPAHLSPFIAEAAQAHGVDPRLVAAVARRESAFNVNAVSPVGASGLMQLMPATAKYLGVTDVFDARQNLFGGTRYLRKLLDTFDGDLDLALAAYNAGPGAVAKYKGVPPYRETRAYVAAIRTSYEQSLRN
jgi:soluble lytic murein transglycosylase-like protein